MTLEICTWLAALVATIGALAINYRKRWGFLLWVVTNSFWVAYDLWKSEDAQAALFVINLSLAVHGWLMWGNHTNRPAGQKG